MEKITNALTHINRLKFKICLTLLLGLVSLNGSQAYLDRTFFAANHRSLENVNFLAKKFNSAVLCVSYCHSEHECKSVNYRLKDQRCELNNATKDKHPDNFVVKYGKVYYDDDVNTPHSSLFVGSTCNELLEAGFESGIYTIFPSGFPEGLRVYCDMTTTGGGWIVIQRRLDGSVDFYRDWADYRAGFGNLTGEFWIGNDNLRALTESEGTWQFRADLEDWNGGKLWSEYGVFRVHGENFALHRDAQTGEQIHSSYDNVLFSTKDRDNDFKSVVHCAQERKGGWWYARCYNANLNGVYYDVERVKAIEGITLFKGNGVYSNTLKTCSMKIRRVA
ncbi:ficolin-2-like [Asterias rubens]|uniref:ficolin-2-like n=1 Tax=Asterias rubens TaxID=7604 RepID=UPI0014557B97|nr:ficolin-2-like [Asterias rubens]